MIIGICTAIILSIFLGDLWIKNHIEKSIVDDKMCKRLGGVLILRKHHNKGAMLNVGERKRSLVAALSVVLSFMVAVLLVFSMGQRGNTLLRIGLSLLLGGAFSNTYDRLKRKYVVDYISFDVKWKWFRNIVFNVSDFCIMIGALLTALGAGQ